MVAPVEVLGDVAAMRKSPSPEQPADTMSMLLETSEWKQVLE
jgi:hypothetical protein